MSSVEQPPVSGVSGSGGGRQSWWTSPEAISDQSTRAFLLAKATAAFCWPTRACSARDLVEAYIAHWERFRGALLLRNQAADRGDPTFHRIRRDALGPLIRELRGLIEESQRAGRVAPDVHPFLAASGLVAILESLAAHADRVSRFGAARQQLVDTCARMLHSTVTGSG